MQVTETKSVKQRTRAGGCRGIQAPSRSALGTRMARTHSLALVLLWWFARLTSQCACAVGAPTLPCAGLFAGAGGPRA